MNWKVTITGERIPVIATYAAAVAGVVGALTHAWLWLRELF